MAAAEKPSNENERLANLRSYQILDTPPSPRFDQLVELAAEICQMPMSLVTLIDAERQWFKARVGIDVDETPRELAFCAHAILDPEPLIIPDATQDARFEDNAFVLNDPQVRFYAGIPLQSPQGYALGTLCVVDMKPRELTPFQLSVLKRLAAQAMDMLELHRLMFVNHEQRARYELALESAEVGLWELPEREGETGWCTPQLYRLLGYSDGEVDFGPEALRQRLHPDDARVADLLPLKQGDGLRGEYRLRTKDGSYRWFSLQGRALETPSTQSRRLVGTMIDIHERRLTQSARERVEAHQQQLVALSYALNLSQTELLERGLGVICEYFELPVGMISLMQGEVFEVLALVAPEDSALQAGARLSREGSFNAQIFTQPGVVSWDTLAPANPERFELLTQQFGIQTLIGTPIWMAGEVAGVLSVFGEQPRVYSAYDQDFMQFCARWVGFMLERYAHLDRLQALSSSKDRMIAVMSHDLRNALGSISSAKQMIVRSHQQQQALNPDFLKIIGDSSQHALGLLEDLLEAAMLEQAEVQIKLGPMSLSSFAFNLVQAFEARAAHKDIRLSSELNFGEAVIALNQRKLYRALENLLQNALKFTPAGGEIRLSVGQTEHEAWLKLEDTGIGIPAELMPALFEKFGPARRPGLAGERSHGLGLYITQEIIAQHGGRIEVSSEPGQGTRFEIKLPLLHQLSPNPVSA